MRIFWFFIVCALTNASTEFRSKRLDHSIDPTATLIEGSFTTRLDHFRPQDNRTVIFKYYGNIRTFREDGPIYIYLSDLQEKGTRWIEDSLIVDIAHYSGAAIFTFEYRYYGNNRPTENAALKDFEQLTFDQILADVAVFINEIRNEHYLLEKSNVILWGSGIGAILAAAARQKYSHLVKGAIASSGSFRFEVESLAPYDHLEQSFLMVDGGDVPCVDRLKNIFEIMDYLVEDNAGEYLKTRFNLCHAVSNATNDISAFFDAQLNFIIDYLNTHHFIGAEDFCHDIGNYDDLNSYARWVNYVYGDVDGHCLDLSYNRILELNNGEEWNILGNRQDYYWKCTQMGNFPITDQYQMLPNRIGSEYRAELCRNLFGEEYNYTQLFEANDALNINIGDLKTVTNIIYTNGNLDPWYLNGMHIAGNSNATVLDLHLYGKSAELTPISGHDSLILSNAKRLIKETVLGWTNEN